MLPLGDDNSLRKSTPVLTYTLIALNVLFFFMEMAGGDSFIMRWSFIPARFSESAISDLPTLFTSMFMHAGAAHLLGNMLYLWIFGDNVEDSFGKVKYLLFYLVSGFVAIGAQYMVNPESTIPNLGASGAIAGVLGAYIVLYPKGRVRVLVGNALTEMPALIVIGLWFAIQFMSGIAESGKSEAGGVAYSAHVGGFLAGFSMAILFKLFSKGEK